MSVAVQLAPAMCSTLLRLLVFFCAGSVVWGADQVYIGNGVFLPDTNLGIALNPLRSIFQGTISAYLREEPYIVVRNSKTFMYSSESIYRELGSSFDLSGPLKVLQLSFGASFNRITRSQSNVTAALVHVESYSKRIFLRTEVARTLVEIPLSEAFLTELRALPEPPSGALPSEWEAYRSFLRRWGTHYVTNIFYGSWLHQWSTAASSSRYSQRDIEARACAQLKGTASVPSVNGCTAFNNTEITNSLRLDMHDELEVRGGHPDTASAIAIHRTEELVARFIREGATSDRVVRYGVSPIWVPVIARYGSSTSKERRVATALEAYYNGFLAFGCPRQTLTSPPTLLQEFRKASNSAMTYRCVRACVGCRQDTDCNYQATPWGCWCFGSSCVADTGEDGRAVVQRYKDSLTRDEGPNRSCEYNAARVRCDCITRNKELHCDLTDNTIPIWDQATQHLYW